MALAPERRAESGPRYSASSSRADSIQPSSAMAIRRCHSVEIPPALLSTVCPAASASTILLPGPGQAHPATPLSHGCVRRPSVREFDVLVENDNPLLVAHDVVAVQTVAELVEVVFPLRALVAFGGQDRLAELTGVD